MYEELIAIETLPPMPATARRLLVMAIDPDVDVDHLSATIAQDPALTAKVLGIANSAYYASRQPVLTVKQAIVQVLGLRMVCNLAFGIALNGALDVSRCPAFDATRYWIVALGTAELAGGLARAATLPDKPDADAAYLAGLLHNIGELALVHARPRDMNAVLTQLAEHPGPGRNVADVERAALGTDRWAAGALLARHWELPAVVGDSIEQLGAADDVGSLSPMAHLLSAARRWIDNAADGRDDTLRVVGVDDAYCEYRSSALLANYDALQALAGTLHA